MAAVTARITVLPSPDALHEGHKLAAAHLQVDGENRGHLHVAATVDPRQAGLLH
jgi:hypothetical protein